MSLECLRGDERALVRTGALAPEAPDGRRLTSMFSPEGPTLRELAVQALSSVEHGYDLLAPKFDHTPFRTPDSVLDAVAAALKETGPYEDGLDLCCGTGAGVDVLAAVCRS